MVTGRDIKFENRPVLGKYDYSTLPNSDTNDKHSLLMLLCRSNRQSGEMVTCDSLILSEKELQLARSLALVRLPSSVQILKS
jgi:hypothetical protein